MHAPASEKPHPRRTTATYRPDASALPSTVSPLLPRNGLPALKAKKKWKSGRARKSREKSTLSTPTLPNQAASWEDEDRTILTTGLRRTETLPPSKWSVNLQEGRSISTQKLCKKTILLPLQHFSIPIKRASRRLSDSWVQGSFPDLRRQSTLSYFVIFVLMSKINPKV